MPKTSINYHLVAVAMAASMIVGEPAMAADFGRLSNFPMTTSVAAGTLKTILRWALKGLMWLARLTLVAQWLEPLIAAIEELLRLLDDAPNSAEVHKKVAELAIKIKDLVAKLARQNAVFAEALQLRSILETLRKELEQATKQRCAAMP